MKNKDFPSFFIAGDNASLKSQKSYITFVKWDLSLMVFSATLSIYNYSSEYTKFWVYVFCGIFLIAATILSLVIKTRKYEDIWYRGRALAESCKTLTWRYITCSEYFENKLSTVEVKRRFTERIKEINSEFKDLNSELSASDLALPIISDKMSEIRASNLDDRKSYYLENRIQEQINWYKSKAKNNKDRYELWFWAVIVAQILAIFSIIYLIKVPNSNFNFVGLFSTFSASFFAWLQVKKYQENKEAYTTATSELNLIKLQGEEIDSENTFAKFVLDSENAMSREHTMWLAQKRQ